jgi:hypothetical protein
MTDIYQFDLNYIKKKGRTPPRDANASLNASLSSEGLSVLKSEIGANYDTLSILLDENSSLIKTAQRRGALAGMGDWTYDETITYLKEIDAAFILDHPAQCLAAFRQAHMLKSERTDTLGRNLVTLLGKEVPATKSSGPSHLRLLEWEKDFPN